jgi:pyruvate dehydrogenase E2 component (dihydrolipoamide acetyltransferase)
VAISPRARRVARELGVEWAALRGSGRTGRIVEKDIRRASSEALAKPAWVASSATATLSERPAAVTLHSAADATELVALANSFASTWPAGVPAAEASLCLMCRLVGLALQEHPLLNASLQDGQIVVHRPVHLTLAMEGGGAFRWPVIRDVSQLSVQRIAEEASRLLERVRAGALSPDDLRGGTFTLVDLGEYDVDTFTPLIVAPQCAVLGLGRIALAPSVYQGSIVPRHKLSLSLTFDHRIVDGAPAARFLKTVRDYVEQPYLWLFR